MSTQASSAVSKEQWLAFADRLIALAYAIFGEAKIDITEKLFGEPKLKRQRFWLKLSLRPNRSSIRLLDPARAESYEYLLASGGCARKHCLVL